MCTIAGTVGHLTFCEFCEKLRLNKGSLLSKRAYVYYTRSFIGDCE